jgi:hypothetical protein
MDDSLDTLDKIISYFIDYYQDWFKVNLNVVFYERRMRQPHPRLELLRIQVT